MQPNAAHLALAQLERAWPGGVLVVTQNVDDLHERAGSRNLLHLHGELMRALCLACGASSPWADSLDADSICPRCAAGGRLRPDIVWFGEMPYRMDEVEAALGHCHLFVSIGTSGQVYPAAGFVASVRAAGDARTIELNVERSAVGAAFAEHRPGPAGETVPRLVDESADAGLLDSG